MWFITHLRSFAGEWLLDARLLHKRLDVRIKGTTNSLSHLGRYENKIGYIILDAVPSSINASVTVKVGYVEARRPFPVCHLFPETTTENPPFVSTEAARPVVSMPGQRVVVIGADLNGDLHLVGSYGIVVASGYVLQPGHAAICISSGDFVGHGAYFEEKSICRSLVT
jgi:hypothetical protein